MNAQTYVAYYRVSTKEQGQSGLGLDAQRSAVANYIAASPGDLISEYTEIESGKNNKRIKLTEALAECKKRGATLLIAKLDRLSRNAGFIGNLMNSKIEFVAVDNPHANKLIIHIIAAFAEHERDMISKRTKEGLAVAKARGVKLGSYSAVLAKRQIDAANAFALKLKPLLEAMEADGYKTLLEKTTRLNALGIETMRGGRWHIMTVQLLRKRIAKLSNRDLA